MRDGGSDTLSKKLVSFNLGNAFGENPTSGLDSLFPNGGVSPTQLQMRTLDTMNLPSCTARRPIQTGQGGSFDTRSKTTIFHDLNPFSKGVLSGVGDGTASNRHDAGSGTKFRTQLSPFADTKIVYQNGHSTSHDALINHQPSSRDTTSASALHPVPSHLPDGYHKSFRHRSSSQSDITLS
ncbi:hypothetical protein tinsulaeT_37000 [Thalassotalea insulae]|uniref:Uncharacterized protein n=2 Tax=Thalassotalea insulae TaxID=2056778 RepID=A0ABQ6H002_9GAMM|nr:hypothetical protein tinsulaeT_37000 [Thalassotalea insulae]